MKKMKSVILASLMIATGLLSVSSARAAETLMHEIEGNSRSALNFGSGTDTDFAIGAGYSYTLMEMLQASTRMDFGISDANTTYRGLIGPTLNYALDETGLMN